MSSSASNSAPTPHTSPAPAEAPAAKGYKDTLNLPKTSFPMKANLVQNEPASLKRWGSIVAGESKGLYDATRSLRAGAPTFSFHDGPPYANGDIHMGHLMNKCLKDFVVRSRTMMGMDCAYVPGWDCHGLPIEHKVMQELVESGKAAKLMTLTDDQRKMAVRRECQKYAEKYVKLQAGQMERLLTLADYAHPYLTMAPSFEGATLEVLAELVEQGLVYRALKPVHWSIANETALAEAELEYQDREDLSVYVDFVALDADAVYGAFGLGAEADDEDTEDDDQPDEGDEQSKVPVKPGVRPHVKPSFMIWTTTPWTLPANVGVAVNPKIEYALVWMDGAVSVLATGLVEKVAKMAKVERVVVLGSTTGDKLIGLRYAHPFVEHPPACGLGRKCDTEKLWSIVAAEYVTTEDGTGLVHTAPGHGEEDYATGLREGLPIYSPVRDNGTYDDTAPEWLRGVTVWDANPRVADWLRRSGHLFFDHTFTHSYPHDWRSKTPVIFRCTEQWFVSVGGPHHTAFRGPKARTPAQANLREMALDAVRDDAGASNHGAHDKVRFVPEWGRNRMRGMLESRPDWCISRQRAWGLPIPAFLTPTGGVLMTAMSTRAVAKVVREKGSDAWFQAPPEELLKYYDPKSDPDPQARHVVAGNAAPGAGQCSFAQLKKGNDILDVWFESGSSWNSCVRERGLGYPIDLYLEGSDQHRGWFQLSLLPALGATGRPPFKTLLTHGFMVDKHGKKMSKSLGNDIKVEALLKDHGADVCRWWVASLSYENDVKVDMEFFNLAGESYRKVRNTLRFMLSNLDDFTPSCPSTGKAGHCVDLKSIAPTSLDAWVLGAFDALSATVRAAYERYDFKTAQESLYNFCNETLSAVYLAAVKDRLYCDKVDSPRRRQAQTVLWELTDGLCRMLAPVLCHTADEAYRALLKVDPKDAQACVHLKSFIPGFGVKPDEAWPLAIAAVEKATKALEQSKQAMGVDNPLDAGVVLPDADGVLARFDPVDLADLIGVSRVTLDASATSVRVDDLRSQPRCERSWKRDGTVRQRADGGMLSDRDAAAIGVA